MEPNEQKIVSKKEFSLLVLSKIIIIVTIIIGLIGTLSAPPSFPYHGGNAINNIANWLMGLLVSLYMIFIFVGLARYI